MGLLVTELLLWLLHLAFLLMLSTGTRGVRLFLPCHTARRQLGLCLWAGELFWHGCCVTAKCKVTLGGFTFVAARVLEIWRNWLRFPSEGKNMNQRSRSAVLRWEMGCFPPLAINLHKCQADSFQCYWICPARHECPAVWHSNVPVWYLVNHR